MADNLLVRLGRRVHRRAVAALQRGAGHFSESRAVMFQLQLDALDGVEAKDTFFPYLVKSRQQGLAVVHHFLFGSHQGVWSEVQLRLEQLILRGDDVLHFAAVLGFLQGERVDEQRFVGYGLSHTPQFGQFAVGLVQLPHHFKRFKVVRQG